MAVPPRGRTQAITGFVPEGEDFRTLGADQEPDAGAAPGTGQAPIKRHDEDGRPSSAIIAPQEGDTVYYTVHGVYSPGPGLVFVSV